MKVVTLSGWNKNVVARDPRMQEPSSRVIASSDEEEEEEEEDGLTSWKGEGRRRNLGDLKCG